MLIFRINPELQWIQFMDTFWTLFTLPNLRKTRGADDLEKGFYLYPWAKISDFSPHEDPQRFLADWQEEGIDYLIVSSLVYGRYFDKDTVKLHPSVVNAQKDYLWFDKNFDLLQEFSPQGIRPGPVIKIYRVRYSQ